MHKLGWLMVGVVGLGLLGGCSGIPPTYYYRVHSEENEANGVNAGEVIPVVIGVTPCTADLLYKGDKIVYRNSPYEVQFYHYRRWVAPPQKLVTEAIVNRFKASGAFQKVVQLPAADRIDYLLKGRIRAFEEWDEPNSWFGLVSLELVLQDPATRASVWQKTFTAKTPAAKKEPVEVVRAISTSLNQVLDEAIAEIAHYLKEREI